ncbi:MAG: L-ribulose-5-phosphate 4-epimerase [Chloroflexi bacterium]|jgi:L-ribulose-5-phosphate 4-epimerase|nr:L-ribulose-5-phosphate 4-epimerase [Chloroflexota bacterium]
MRLPELRQAVCQGNLLLPASGLVTWTSGNVSGRDPETGLVVIKPSGVRYEALTPEKMVVLDLDGQVIEGDLRPSVDAPTHLYVYRHRPDVMGVVHTHSTFATAFAAVGRPIPVYLTAIADEFGGPIPVGAYAQIGEEQIGEEIVRSIGASCAILMQNHGVFTVGASVMAAVKAAVMTEDVARTVYYALQLGQPIEIPPDEVVRGHERYLTQYGQK